jgi:photosystem II stability/assembly factor-like uncharacterized protein
MKHTAPTAHRRVRQVGLLLALLAALLPARPAAAQSVKPEVAGYEIFMPMLLGEPSQEVKTVDSLILGRPALAEAAEKPAHAPSDTPQIEPPPPGEARAASAPDGPKDGPAFVPATAAGWSTLMSEGFEGDFPSAGWRVVDDSGVSGREITWDDDDYRARSGSWSAWAANGGQDGLDPATYRYAGNMRAWMIYGPFTLAEAAQATLTFDYWNRSERNYDWFGWYASADGVNFHGWRVSGDSGGWRTASLDLSAVPVVGNLRGDASVWIAFVFRSDTAEVEAGPFVDNVALQQATGGACPDQAQAEYFPNPELVGAPVLTRCESWSINYNWGTGSPAAALPADGFSARWTGTVALPAGRYTFLATVDDGLRLWLDDKLLLDSWRVQSQVTIEAATEVSAGVHRLKIEYFESTGNAEARVNWFADSACPSITEWRGDYWTNAQLSGAPALCRNDANLDFDWGVGSPSADLPVDNFSARWTRTVNFNAGTYRFHLRGDDGVRLWIDDELVIDEWRNQSATEFTATRSLSAGSHKLKVEYYEALYSASVRLRWEVAPGNAVVISNRPAFDTCFLPTPSQMAAWWGNSPYAEVNLYIGGANRGCESHNSQYLNAQWVETVGNQGWNFIPTWVGPQAPCTNFISRMSNNSSEAYAQGRSEADAAARAAQALGLTTSGTGSGLGGTVIYYDMEPYDIQGYPQVPNCRGAVNAFVDGWVERLNELGNRAGVYGASCASNMSDWVGLEHVPDDIWPAHWVDTTYNPNISVWNVACIDNSLWSNHQRIRQYAGDHNETYGGVTIYMDSNIVDGRVAGKNPRSSAALSAQAIAPPAPLRGLELLPSGAGWLLTASQLQWTADGGASWRAITPAEAAGKSLRGATFVDEQHGWLVWAAAPDAENRSALFVAATEDGGATWQTTPLRGFDPVDPNSTQTPVTVHFVDDQTGWIMIRLASSLNFSQAVLFGTRDGGQTWTPLALPSAGTLRFVNASHGWLAGGAAGETLYRTTDGGESWQPVALPLDAGRATYHLPAFADTQTGVAPVTHLDGAGTAVTFYSTSDGGEAWTLAASLPLSGTQAVVAAVAPDQPDQWWVADPASGKLHQVRLGADEAPAGVEIVSRELLPGVTDLTFAAADQGLAAARAVTCFGDKTGADPDDPFRCVWQQSVVRSADGGQTWSEITPGP